MRSILLILSLFVSGQVFALGDAGCGLGGTIIGSNGKLTQLLAMTTNFSFFTQGFGITSGTSGCSAHGLVMSDKEIQYFVEVNQEDLSREMAKGQGEKLSTLASLHGCKNPGEIQAFSSATQQNLSHIMPSSRTSASDVVQNIKASEIPSLCHGS